MKNITLISFLLLAFSLSAYSNIAHKILKDNLDARGGIEKLSKIKNIQFKVVSAADVMPVSDTSSNIYKGDKYRIESSSTRSVLFDNGIDGYYKSLVLGAPKLKKMNSMERAQFQSQFGQMKGLLLGFAMMAYQRRDTLEIKYLGTEKLADGTKVKKIEVSMGVGTSAFLFFDTESKLNKKIEMKSKAGITVLELKNYIEVDGIKFSSFIPLHTQGKTINQYILDLQINHEIDDELFEAHKK